MIVKLSGGRQPSSPSFRCVIGDFRPNIRGCTAKNTRLSESSFGVSLKHHTRFCLKCATFLSEPYMMSFCVFPQRHLVGFWQVPPYTLSFLISFFILLHCDLSQCVELTIRRGQSAGHCSLMYCGTVQSSLIFLRQ